MYSESPRNWAKTAVIWPILSKVEKSSEVGVKVTSSTQAILAALEESGSESVSLLTPYVKQAHDQIAHSFGRFSYEVSGGISLGLSDNA